MKGFSRLPRLYKHIHTKINTQWDCFRTCVDSARELFALAQKLSGAGVSSGIAASSRLSIRGFLVGSWLVRGVTLFLLIRVPWLLFISFTGRKKNRKMISLMIQLMLMMSFLHECQVLTSGLSRCVFTASMFNEIDSTLHPRKIRK